VRFQAAATALHGAAAAAPPAADDEASRPLEALSVAGGRASSAPASAAL
jgi:hypothetical protein